MRLDWLLSWIPQSVRDPLVFEVRSRIGRMLARDPRLDPAEPLYLNVGSGPQRFDDFLNIDFFELLEHERSSAPYLGADLRYPLPLPSGCADGVFTEHTLEHLTYPQAERLLRECWRVLKTGCRLRVVLPDLGLFAERYAAGDAEWFKTWERLYFTESDDAQRRLRSMETPMMAISFVTQEYGHVSAWDFATLSALLTRAGFSDIRRTTFREGADPRLARDLDSADRRHVSLYAEAVKR